jgi:hypothetical protein
MLQASRLMTFRDGWMNGPRRACSSSCKWSCWTRSTRPAASTWTASASTPSACGRSKGDLTGPNPVDRGKAGAKLHLAGERNGLPISVVLSAANANDSTMLEAVVDLIPPILMPTGRRRRRPGKVHPDKAYDHRRRRAYLRRRGTRPRIAPRGIESPARLVRYRCTNQRRRVAGRVAGAVNPLRALLRAVLRAGAAGLFGHLLPGAATATVVQPPRAGRCPCRARYGCSLVTQTIKRRLLPW